MGFFWDFSDVKVGKQPKFDFGIRKPVPSESGGEKTGREKKNRRQTSSQGYFGTVFDTSYTKTCTTDQNTLKGVRHHEDVPQYIK